MYDGFCFCSNSTKLIATKVSAAVKNSFARRYPGIITMWEKEDGKYEASFKKDGDSMSALFEQNGTMAESEIGIKVSALPAAVLS